MRGAYSTSSTAIRRLLAVVMALFIVCPTLVLPTEVSAETRLGNINTRFTIYPNESEGGTLNGNNLTIVPVKDSGGVSVTVNIDLSTSGSDPAKPGELELLIPRTIFEVRDMSHAKVDIPYPADGSGDWKYTFVDAAGNPVSEDSLDCKYIKLVNNISIDPAHTQSMGIAYSVRLASCIVDESDVDFQPTLTLKQGTQEATITPTPLNVQVDTHIEIANAAKSTNNSYVTDQWLDAWGPKPSWYTEDKEGQYFFLMWELSAYLKYDSATQPYKLTYAEPNTVPDGGIICGYMDWYSNNTGSGERNESENTKALLSEPPEKEVLPQIRSGYSPSGVTKDAWYSGVLVAYPKPTSTPKEYTNTFTATVTPYDGKDEPTSLTSDGKFTYKDLNLNTPEGEMYYLEKLKGWIANDALYRRLHGGIDRLQAGVPLNDIAYSISGYAYQYTKEAGQPGTIRSWGAEYTSELVDDMFFLNVDPNCRLGDGDMEITRINPQWEAYEYHTNMAIGGYEEVEVDYTKAGASGAVSGSWAKDYPELIAYGKSDNGEWQKIATFAINTEGRPEVKEIHLDGASYYNDETHSGGVKIAKGTGITQIKYSITANEGKSVEDKQGVIRVRFERRGTPGGAFHSWDSTNKSELYLTLYPTQKVKDAVQAAVDQNVKSDPMPAGGLAYDGDGGEGDGFAPVAKLHNIDHIAVYTGADSDKAQNKDLKGAFLPQGESDPNFKDVLETHDRDLYGTTMWHKKAQVELTPYLRDSAIAKTSEYENDPGNNRVIIHYTSEAKEAVITHDTDVPQELIEYGIIPLQQSGTFYDLLPQGMTIDPASINGEASAEDAAVELEYEMFPNYKGSGRTLLVVKVSTDAPNWKSANLWNKGIDIERDNTTLPHIESGFTITYDGYYDWESLADYGNTVTNYIGYESGNDRIENGVDDDASQWKYTDFKPVEEYFKDLDETEPTYDEDGNPVERLNFLYTNDSTTLTVVTQARYGLTKRITAPTVAGWVTGRIGEGALSQVGVPTGGTYQYRLRYASEPGTTVKNLVLFDGLEAYQYIRDKKTGTDTLNDNPKSDPVDVDRDGYEVVTWQGTFESIDVSKIEAMEAKADIYYTTKDRKELQVDDQSNKSDTLADLNNPAGSKLADCWEGPYTADALNALDDATKATITGLAIDMRKKKDGTTDFELDSAKSVAAIVTMRAPDDPLVVRNLVKQAQDQYDNAPDEEKSITNDKPYAYNAVNLNAAVKEKGSSSYSEAHLITYEYTRAYLYVPRGNISIAKKVTGLSEAEAAKYTFKVKAAVKDPADGTEHPFAGKYSRIDTNTGYYYTDESVTPPYTDDDGVYHAEGVFVNMGTADTEPTFVTWASTGGEDGQGAWVPCDKEGDTASPGTPAEEDYVFKTTDGQEDFTISGNQRIVLIDCEADLEWTVSEVEESAAGFRASHRLNGKDGEDDYVTEPFVIGDQNTARIEYTNMASAELVVKKTVAMGDEDKLFDFNVTITDAHGEEYLDWEGNPMVFDYVGEADEGVEPPQSGTIKSGDTIRLMHGQCIRIYVPGGTKYRIEEHVPSNYKDPTIEKTYDDLVVEGEGEDATTSYNSTTSTSDGRGEIKERGDVVTETFTNTHKPDDKPKKTVEGNDVDDDKIDELDGSSEKADGEDTTNEEKTHVDLGAYANPVTYTIRTDVPLETKTVVLTDTLEDVLEFVSAPGDIVVLDGEGNPIEEGDLKVTKTIEGQTLTVKLEFAEPEEKDDEGNVVKVKNHLEEVLKGAVVVQFVAQIREGADLAPYTQTGTTLIPNTASVKFNNRPEVESEKVTITPPPPEEKIDKKVKGKTHYDLKAKDEVYDYSIDLVVPVDADKVVMTDTLEPVLQFADGTKDVEVLYGEEPVKGAVVAIKGQTLTVTLNKDAAVAHRTHTLTVRFHAQIKEGADLAPYATSGVVLIPNTAAYEINNSPDRRHESEPVTVTPPPEEDIEKKVMGEEHYDLKGADEVYDYSIDVTVPGDAEAIEVTDTLEDVLELAGGVGQVKVLYGGKAVDGAKVSVKGQELKVTLQGKAAKEQRTHRLTIEFRARVKSGADLTPYLKGGQLRIPNQAEYLINGDASRRHRSNVVTVTPPVGKAGTVTPKTGDPALWLAAILAMCMAMAVAWRVRRERRAGQTR